MCCGGKDLFKQRFLGEGQIKEVGDAGRLKPLLQSALLTLPGELWARSGQWEDSGSFLLVPLECTVIIVYHSQQAE